MNLDDLRIEVLPTECVRPYVYNARTHDPDQVAQVAASIKEFGFTNPILIDATGQVIAGHCRLEAAQSLGLPEVPCLRLGNLSDAQRRAYILADNRLAENSGWDRSMLRLELTDLKDEDFDLGLLGFREDELEELLKLPGEGEGDDADRDDEEQEFTLTITSTMEHEIIALRRIFGLGKKAAKVKAARVIELLPVGLSQ